MTTAIVTFQGIHLGGSSSYGWAYVSGVEPLDLVFTVSAARAESLRGTLGVAGSLVVKPPDRDAETWRNVYLLEIQPGADPHHKRIRLADERWKWPKRWISTTMNKLRATGGTFFAKNSGNPAIENASIADELVYAKYSMAPVDNPQLPWTAREALEYIVGDVLGTTVIFDDEPPDETPIQDLVIDDQGHVAVQRVLAYLPGMAGYIGKAGEFVIYDTRSKRAEQLLTQLPEPQRGGGTVEVVDKRAQRPSKVHVLFTPEVEMQFNFWEGSIDSSPGPRDLPYLYPIMRIPDASLDIKTYDSRGQVGSTTVPRGGIADQRVVFEAWGPFGTENTEITMDILRKRMVAMGTTGFLQSWGNPPNTPPGFETHRLYAARAQAAASSWRTMFQIDTEWLQRLESVRAVRAGLLVPHLGIYAPAEVFCDWTRRPSFWGRMESPAQPNVYQGFTARGFNDDGTVSVPAPVAVVVEDSDAGIIRLIPQVDPYGQSNAMYLGYPSDGILPAQDLGEAKRRGLDVWRLWHHVEFEGDWRLAVILTVVPGSPNTIDRFHKVTIDAPPSAGPSVGPEVYARVFPGVMTARFKWDEDPQGYFLEQAITEGAEYPESALINREWVNDVAEAVAARVYEGLLDRPQGNMTTDWYPEASPRGSLNSVSHTMRGGRTVTSMSFMAVDQLPDIWGLLNASTRVAIMRVLNNPGSAG